MKSPLRILHLEDNPNDTDLVQAMLAADGIAHEVVRVETRDAFVAALEEGGFELIISDYTLPSYDGRSALLLARAKRPEVPFIFFSGTLGEELAVDVLKEGATDYVVKSRPARFVSAVVRALREAEEKAEHKRLEEQFRQAQKMEAIGQLAGGIAHDFNNLLTVINGYSELMLQTLSADDPQRNSLEQIKTAGKRAALLTQQILAFSRRQVLEPRVLDLNEAVATMDKLLRRMIGEDIALVSSPDPALWRVKADPGQIEQIIMNLAVNARDAMSQGGKLTIETANVELDEAYARRHASVQPGPYVMLAVSDTGIGMDAKTQARIFEPFFTTKEPGKGTGLGLSTVYGIVKQSGGNIWIYSEPGKGATFKIYLPRVDEEVEVTAPVPVRPETLRGSETILLVEDDEMVRALAGAILQYNDYTVLETRNGQEALRICQEHPGPIHLLITDVVMPGMSGRELADRLAPLRPSMKILYMSGYTDNAIVRHGVLDIGTAFLQKPFTPVALAQKVRKVLDTPPRDTDQTGG